VPTSSPLTKPQIEQMARAIADGGTLYWKRPRGYAEANWRRMMERLSEAGLFAPNAHDGFEITEAGRAAYEAASLRTRGAKDSILR